MKSIFDFLRKLGSAINIYFPAVVFVTLAILTFTFISQARDVLTISAEHQQGSVMLYLAVLCWAYFTWYSSRIVAYHKPEVKAQEFELNNYLRWVPRALGALCFAAPAIAILDLSYLNIPNTWIYVIAVIYFIAVVIFSVVLNRSKESTRVRSWVWYILLILGLGIPVFIGTTYNSGIGDHLSKNLLYSALWLLISSFIFLFFTALRNKKTSDVEKEWTFRWFFIEVKLPRFEKPWFFAFNIIASFVVIFYMFGTLNLEVARFILPTSAPIIAFIFLLGLGNVLSFLGMQLKWNLHLTVWVWAFVVAMFIEPHWVRMLKGDEVLYNDRPNIETYFENKLQDDSTLVFILADGGASRSGYWTSSVLGKLTDEYGDNFSSKIFAMSGASGGAVGITAYYSLLSDSVNHRGNYLSTAQNYFSNDFLSYTIMHMVGADIFRYIIPNSFFGTDRAAALEYSLEKTEQSNACARQMAKPYYYYLLQFKKRLEQKRPMPLLMLNTTDLNQGWPGVVSFIDLEGIGSNRIDVLDTVDKSGIVYGYNDIRLSTAAILCSRFPYISPAGRIRNSYFIDGGYFDNSGAGIVHEIMLKLDELSPKKLNYKVIHLQNTANKPTKDKRLNPLVNDLLTPPMAAGKIIFKQTDMNNDRLKDYLMRKYEGDELEDHWISLNLLGDNDDSTNANQKEETYSMSWVISKTQRTNMQKEVGKQIGKYKTQFDFWFKGN